MKKATLLSFFLVVCAIAQAQTSDQLPNNPKLLKANEEKLSRLADGDSKKILVSEYFGLEEQILSFLTNKEMPAQLPKARGFESRSKYVEALNIWMKENSSFVLPEKQNQLITE